MTDKNEPIDNNDGELTDEEAVEIAEDQTASTSENADEAGKDWQARDLKDPKPL